MDDVKFVEKSEGCETSADSTESIESIKEVMGFNLKEFFFCFNANFLNEPICREWILKKMHPDIIKCPSCKSVIIDATTLNNFWGLKRCRCKNCNKWFSATTGTFIDRLHLTMSELSMLAVFLHLRAPHKIIAEKLNIHSVSVNQWEKKFKMFEENRNDNKN